MTPHAVYNESFFFDRIKPVALRYGYTAIHWNPASWSIRSATGGLFSHTFPIFVMEDGSWEYFESLSTLDRRTGKTGVRGPYPISKVEKWADSSNRRILDLSQPGIPLSSEELQLAYQYAVWATLMIRYAHLQIASNWMLTRTGLSIVRPGRSEHRWTCSEFAARLLSVNPALAVSVFDIGNNSWNDVMPSGRRGVGLYESVNDYLGARR